MKKFIALALAALSFSAFAHNSEGQHMLQFGTDNSTLGIISWEKEKTRGSKAEESRSRNAVVSYAHKIHSNIQAGLRLQYGNYQDSTGTIETYGAQVGGYYNLDTDFSKSIYASVFAGWNWGRITQPNKSIESFISTFAVGKRFPLFNEHFTYSPEVAYKTTNATTSSNTEYTESLEFRVIQFAVFF